MVDIKRCSNCDVEKSLSEFCFTYTKIHKDTQKYRSYCIQCCSIKQKGWRDKNPEKIKQNQKIYNEQNKKKKHIS